MPRVGIGRGGSEYVGQDPGTESQPRPQFLAVGVGGGFVDIAAPGRGSVLHGVGGPSVDEARVDDELSEIPPGAGANRCGEVALLCADGHSGRVGADRSETRIGVHPDRR